jgi:hypothetical protein
MEGTAEVIPGASLLTKIYAVTHPPIEEVERQKWATELSQRSNEHDDLLKKVIGAFIQLKTHHEHANRASQLTFFRNGLLGVLETIAKEGLTKKSQHALRQKLDESAPEVEDIIEGLELARMNLGLSPGSDSFAVRINEIVVGKFGKVGIRERIKEIVDADASKGGKRELAKVICEEIEVFNRNVVNLGNYASSSVHL